MPSSDHEITRSPQSEQDGNDPGERLFEAGNYSGARLSFENALRCAPDSAQTLARLAASCARLGDWPAAESRWRELLSVEPGLAVAQTGLGIALREQGRIAEAIAIFTEASESHPSLAPVHFNLGTCLLRSDRPKDAIAAFRRSLVLDPRSAETRFNLSLALMKAGRFTTGALAYESRWQAQSKGEERPFAGPRWNGRSLPADETLLLWGEQGIGDEIMFAGLVPCAIRAAAGPVAVECASRLVPLYARSFPEVRVFPRTEPPHPSFSDAMPHCPTGSLPGLFWSDQPDAPPPFLRAEPSEVAHMRGMLARLGSGRKIGIVWRGGHPAAGRPRFIPPTAWEPLFRQQHLTLINLQHSPDPAELKELETRAGRPIHRISDIDPLKDMDAFAALVAALDLVVGADNSTIHLAGALGVPTGLLLSDDTDWRWGVDGVPCPWYRSVTRLRQNKPGDWSAPMAAAAEIATR